MESFKPEICKPQRNFVSDLAEKILIYSSTKFKLSCKEMSRVYQNKLVCEILSQSVVLKIFWTRVLT